MPRPPDDPLVGEWGMGARLCISGIFRRCRSLRAVIFLLSIWLCAITVINLGSSGQRGSLGLKDDSPLFPDSGNLPSFSTLFGLSPADKRMAMSSNVKVDAILALRSELRSSIKRFTSEVKSLQDGQANLVNNGFISGRRIQEIQLSQMGGFEMQSRQLEGGSREEQSRNNTSNSNFITDKRSQIVNKELINIQPHIQATNSTLEDLQSHWKRGLVAHISKLSFPSIPKHDRSETQGESKQNLTVSSQVKIQHSKSKDGYASTRSQNSGILITTGKYGLYAHGKFISGHLLQNIGESPNRVSNFYESISEIDTYFHGDQQHRAREKDMRMSADHSRAFSVKNSYHTLIDPSPASGSTTNTQTSGEARSKSNLQSSVVMQMAVPKRSMEFLSQNSFDQNVRTSGSKMKLGVNYPANFLSIYQDKERSRQKQNLSVFNNIKHPNLNGFDESKAAAPTNEFLLISKEDDEQFSSVATLQKNQLSHPEKRSTLNVTLTSINTGEIPDSDAESNRKAAMKSKQAKSFKYDGFELYSYNVTASNLLLLNRDIPDTRPAGCQHLPAYAIMDLPKTTVIICFHNEALSVLLRTVHSVLDRTPSYLLEQIILVDDYSTQEELSSELEEHVSYIDKILLTRTSKREGLVGARILGSRLAKSEVIVFLDAHCECNVGWLEPLLFSLSQNPHKVVSPYIDTIKSANFQYKQSPPLLRGGFTWRLEFGWRAAIGGSGLLEETQPILTPVISGGLFAVRHDYFVSMGTYDPHLNIWGGENFELSFKTWMCGGSVEIVPCSRVGHVFRASLPYSFTEGREKTVLRNLARVASVWMDEYADIFYAAVNLPNDLDIGDTSTRTQLRRDLNCKSFKWYLENVFPEMDIVSQDTVVYGQVRNKGSLMCIDIMNSGSGHYLGLSACNGDRNQTLQLTSDNQLKQDSACIVPGLNKQLTLSQCRTEIKWIYEVDQLQINGTNLCMTSVDNEMAHLLPCFTDHNIPTVNLSYSAKVNNSGSSDIQQKDFKGHNSWSSNSFQQWTFDYSFNWKRRRRRMV